MQTTLEKAIAKLQTLPPEKQEWMATVILQELEKTAMSKEQIAILEAQELEGYKRYPPQKDEVDAWQDEQVWES
jgi:D-alanyl-D-alanine dipeptidase